MDIPVEKISVIVFEDNMHFSESLSLLLNLSERFTCAFVSSDTMNIIEDIHTYKPQLLLMDIEMPGMNGIEATKLVKQTFPDLLVLMLTSFDDDDKIFQSLCAGGSGYLLKNATAQQILQALTDVYNGGSAFSPMVARRMVNFFQNKMSYSVESDKLTLKEKAVLQELVKGNSYKMIAAELGISFETVKGYIKNIYKKLHVNNSTEAVAKAIRQRIV
ncbi:MAG TPA: response regulator transcription factor [Ferruginibacter sp.]|nr:response regulator transcription factor [Ferruginibacter sp.]